MPSPAYNKASRSWGLWITLTVAGVAGLYVTMMLLISTGLDRKLGMWSVVIGLLPLGLAVGTGLVWISRVNRNRISAITDRLNSIGFHAVPRPTESEKNNFAEPILHLFPALELQQGASRIQWLATEQTSSAKSLLFEHRYVTGSGKYSQEHLHTVVAWPAGHPDVRDPALATAPWFLMRRASRFQRRTVRSLELNSPDLADLAETWSLLGDASTGARFLTPNVRATLQHARKSEVWCCGANWVCCEFKGTLDVENLERFLGHARRVVAAGRFASQGA